MVWFLVPGLTPAGMEMKCNLLNTVRGLRKAVPHLTPAAVRSVTLHGRCFRGEGCESFIQCLPRFVKNILVRCHHRWQYISAHQNRGVRLRCCQQESLWGLESESGSCFLWLVVPLGLRQSIKTGNLKWPFSSQIYLPFWLSAVVCIFSLWFKYTGKQFCAEHEGFSKKNFFKGKKSVVQKHYLSDL